MKIALILLTTLATSFAGQEARSETELLALPKVSIRFAAGTPQGVGLKVVVEVDSARVDALRERIGVLQDIVFIAGFDFLVSARRTAPQPPSTTLLKERIEIEAAQRLGLNRKMRVHLQELSFQ